MKKIASGFLLAIFVSCLCIGALFFLSSGVETAPTPTVEVPTLTPEPTQTNSPTAFAPLLEQWRNYKTPTITPTATNTRTLLPTSTRKIPTATYVYIQPEAPDNSGQPQYPVGVTAICKDGTYSYSNSARGTCSSHGGVKKWINKPK